MAKVWFGDKDRSASPAERGLLFAAVSERGWKQGVEYWTALTTLDGGFAAKLKQFSWKKCEADCGGRSLAEMTAAVLAEQDDGG